MNKIFLISVVIIMLVLGFLIYQNKSLKMEVKAQGEVIISQKSSLNLWQEKQLDAIKAIEIKEQEIQRIETERKKNEQEFNKKASSEYHQWRNTSLPPDILNRLF
ncbi:MAG: hypothetical protein BWY78_00575 [Alphaproteobacteria bacterium ADurb.Bin438]|nr:MAG: hypothetical protein BWY78_00575 [Alphaproteobacteria bacterium ADurb.Bin438]